MIGALQVYLYAATCAFRVFLFALPLFQKCHVKNGNPFVLVFPAGVFPLLLTLCVSNEADRARWQKENCLMISKPRNLISGAFLLPPVKL